MFAVNGETASTAAANHHRSAVNAHKPFLQAPSRPRRANAIVGNGIATMAAVMGRYSRHAAFQ
jgi:hypothetical protein